MPNPYSDSVQTVRQEIAARAARMIAEDGMDYASAKRRAVRDVVGTARVQGDFLPDNDEIEAEVRIYQQLFLADSQPARVAVLRAVAVRLMRLLAPFNPHLSGAVLKGTASEHSDIYLQLYPDSGKDVQIFLLNQGVDFEAHDAPHPLGRGRIETLSFMWPPGRDAEGVHLVLHDDRDARDLRGAGERADLATLERLIALEQEQSG